MPSLEYVLDLDYSTRSSQEKSSKRCVVGFTILEEYEYEALALEKYLTARENNRSPILSLLSDGIL